MILMEERCSASVALVGFTSAMPPSLAGRAKRSRSVSLGGGLPVSAGISLDCFKWHRTWTDTRHSASEVGPLAGHPMSESSMCCMRLAACNGC